MMTKMCSICPFSGSHEAAIYWTQRQQIHFRDDLATNKDLMKTAQNCAESLWDIHQEPHQCFATDNQFSLRPFELEHEKPCRGHVLWIRQKKKMLKSH